MWVSGQLLHVAKRNAAIGWEHVQCSAPPLHASAPRERATTDFTDRFTCLVQGFVRHYITTKAFLVFDKFSILNIKLHGKSLNCSHTPIIFLHNICSDKL